MPVAPIALFVYNRPEHTAQTLEALTANDLASESHLFVFCDGPKKDANENTLKAIQKVREVVKSKSWCKTVTIYESDNNKGLANSIVEGVTKIVNEHGKIIVLEDDIVTSKGFLTYMNEALNIYENEPKVFQISGFTLPIKYKKNKTYLYRAPGSWGWGTWTDKWKFYEHDLKILGKYLKNFDINRFNINGAYSYSDQFEQNTQKKINTWGVRWYISIYNQDGLCLYPYKSLILNIGHDGTGVNCNNNKSQKYLKPFIIDSLKFSKIENISESKLALNLIINNFKSRYVPSYKTRLINKLKQIFNVN